ncbi:MAG: murein transglycosylase domain-containing protein [Kangiellaceae bacterium]|jgi:membrane-bound lytic murein transglycosylase C|nr:murein transglycosylase domain-containing protein [Kangiellaceae bacterium]
MQYRTSHGSKWTGKLSILGLAIAISLASPTYSLQEECDEMCQEQKEYAEFLAGYQKELEDYERSVNDEWTGYLEETRKQYQEYAAKIQGVWGNQTALSDKKNWVEYSDNLTSQTKVDFDNSQITIKNIAGLSQSQFNQELKKELIRLLRQTERTANKKNPLKKTLNKKASPNEKQVVSDIDRIFSKYSTEDPQVLSEVSELTGETSVDKQAEKLANMAKVESSELTYITNSSELQYASNSPLGLFLASAKTKKRKVMVARINLSQKWTSLRAKKYQPYVDAFSKEWGIEKPLVYSIMFNESSFNPAAISPIPAYGLMQVVPESAGADVAQRHFKQEVLFSPDFLFTPKNNIAIGVGYLNLLNSRYFRQIKDPQSRMFCVIAAYNTGPGNVARALTNTKKLKLAINAANKMTSEQVYRRLISDLPYDETKNYLKKVAKSIPRFENI